MSTKHRTWCPVLSVKLSGTLALFLSLSLLAFCGCDPAQSKNIPAQFGQDNFDDIVKYALDNYIDPGVDTSRGYVGAAESALRALPYPLILYPKSFYQNQNQLLRPIRIIPGKVVPGYHSRSFVILEPDWKAYEKKRNQIEEREQKEREGLSNNQRAEKAQSVREQIQGEQKALEEAWRSINFSRDDFREIVVWIEDNRESYMTPPDTESQSEAPDFDPSSFGLNHVYFAAANGFLKSLDPHSAILDMETWDKIRKESEDSTFEGIGAMLRGGGSAEVIVETPLPGSPALKAGLRAGDIIKKVDGNSIEGLPLSDVVKQIRGPRDTTVTLTVERPTTLETLDIPIRRGVIEQKAVSSTYIPDSPLKAYTQKKIGVIKLSSFLFDRTYPSDLIREEYESLVNQADGKLEGLVLDLRGNPGGDLREAIKVAGLFLPKGLEVVEIKGRRDSKEEKNNLRPIFLHSAEAPLVVMIDAGSASASEIVASALKDHNAALIVGERSFGKATVQSLESLGDVIIKLTTARYYAPDGYTIQVYGVHPDIAISPEADGTFPPRFREEDMWQHLPELQERKKKPARQAWIQTLNDVVGENEAAEKFLKEHKDDAIKPDAALIRAIAYFDALKKKPRP
ncbi:MAG: peptidase S41 [Spirochaetaceae bacterium]|nr:peptidase S41 [Spirochaetaceae bacterium]